MKVSGDKKRRDFICKFLELYSEIYYLETGDKDECKLKNSKKEICKLLPDYHYLFDDLNFLYKTYNEYFLENPNFILKDNFKSFVGWVFDELYEQKIVNKETFDELSRFLVKLDMNNVKVGLGLGGGAI